MTMEEAKSTNELLKKIAANEGDEFLLSLVIRGTPNEEILLKMIKRYEGAGDD